MLPDISLALHCYATRDHGYPIWKIPNNSYFNPVVFNLLHQSILYFNSSAPHNSVENFVCQSSNNKGINSSVIITNSKSNSVLTIMCTIISCNYTYVCYPA